MDWIVYLFQLFFIRIGDFLRHWYVSGFHAFTDWTVRFLELLDRVLALKVSVRYWFQPLFQERSVFGYLIGFFARTIRIIFASVIYTLVILIAFGIYLAWILLPIWLVYKIVQAYGIKTDIF
ncbi:MAG: hypothetical protein M1586_02490 [Patescibacteria group bacterium]|nr:hypothetical protein [Patescibacteria group bacterium]MCL5262141.1 hypothetical protein [Patescibacteria group bacterium]